MTASLLSGSCAAEPDWKLIGHFNKDPSIFTQGLEINDDTLWYSSGRYGKSFLLSHPLNKPEQTNKYPLPSNIFAEGISIDNNQLTLLTWKAGKAYEFSVQPFQATGSKNYAGQGWGLCSDGQWHWMSNGSELIFQRNLNDFSIEKYIPVSYQGEAVNKLNELECFEGLIAANQWKTDYVYLINPQSGQVVHRLDFSALKSKHPQGVLNGIAWDKEKQEMLITGKNWDTVYRVKILLDLNKPE